MDNKLQILVPTLLLAILAAIYDEYGNRYPTSEEVKLEQQQ